MNLWTLALCNLRRRPARNVIVTLSVGLAIGSAITMIALSNSIEHGTSEGMDERGADLAVLQKDASDIFSGFVPQSVERQLAALPGVAAVTGELATYAPVEHDRHRLIVGWTEASFFWRLMPLSEGRAPSPGERRVALLGTSSAESLRKRVGDDIDILGETFKVIAVTGYVTPLNRSVIILPLEDLQRISFRSGQVTLVHLKLSRGLPTSEIARIQEDVKKLGRLEVAPTDQLLRNDRNLAVLKAISRAISTTALTLGALSVLSAMLMAVQERTREIGVMRAIGWSRRQTIASIVIEGVIIGLAGGMIGLGLGFAASLSFSSIPQIGSYLSFHPTLDMFLPTLAAAVLMCAAGSLYPAWRATQRTPAEAMRGL